MPDGWRRYTRSAIPRTTILAVAICLATPGARAETNSTKTWELGLSPLYAYVVKGEQGEPRGGGGRIHLRRRIFDAFAFGVAATWTFHHLDAPQAGGGRTLNVVAGLASLSYAVDVMGRWTPSIEACAGAQLRQASSHSNLDPVVEIGLALDYAIHRSVSVGIGVRYRALLRNPDDLPIYVELGPRALLHW